MPDIAMCPGKDCPARIECFRYMATPRIGRQRWSNYDERREDDGCYAFLKIWNRPPRGGEIVVVPI